MKMKKQQLKKVHKLIESIINELNESELELAEKMLVMNIISYGIMDKLIGEFNGQHQ